MPVSVFVLFNVDPVPFLFLFCLCLSDSLELESCYEGLRFGCLFSLDLSNLY